MINKDEQTHINSLFSGRLKELRIEHQYTMDHVENATGISTAHSSLVENGKRGLTINFLIKLSPLYGFDVLVKRVLLGEK